MRRVMGGVGWTLSVAVRLIGLVIASPFMLVGFCVRFTGMAYETGQFYAERMFGETKETTEDEADRTDGV